MITPVPELLAGARAEAHPAALGGGAVRTWGEFRGAAGRVAARAREAGGDRWLLACEEAWDFATGLVGLLRAGRTVVVPPNFLPETLARLGVEAHGSLRGPPGAGPALEDGPLTGSVVFATSGSTGAPKSIPRTLAQLDAEVALLEASFGGFPLGAPVAGTVPHQHIYGCLFRILWPLAAGRPFLLDACGDPARFLRAMALAPVLVSSPAHLSRLLRILDLEALPGPPVAIFSSGGALARADALGWRGRVPGGVVEIYGSTESGGIAWRRQGEAPSEAWTPLPDTRITVAGDGALVVTSFRAGPSPLRMEDAAVLEPDGTFRLLGRLDRTIKLEEKRISLPELEAALEAHPRVDRAAVALLEGARPLLGAAVVLAGGGGEGAFGAKERGALVEALRRHLAQRFEAVAVPRRWRFPVTLPCDDSGKVTSGALAGLFESPRP
jgi:acyl-coenzyme A synthetase/AMP-(fatty) acid ligase